MFVSNYYNSAAGGCCGCGGCLMMIGFVTVMLFVGFLCLLFMR